MESHPLNLSVVIPVYKNAATLEQLYQRLVSSLEGCSPFELIFVDDACPQDSFSILRKLCIQDTRVCALQLAKNMGQNYAVLAGLSEARGKRVVILDADLQDPPEVIPQLAARLDTGFSIVFAGRRGRYETSSRLLTSKLYKSVLHLICGIPADAGIFMVLERSVVDNMLALYAPQPFIVSMAGCLGTKMSSIPVERSSRSSGVSAYSSWKRLQIGLMSIVWAVLWKTWYKSRRIPGQTHAFTIRERLGARFNKVEENLND